MSTGACGIDCGSCRLHRSGVCGSCGGGRSEAGCLKMAAQKRLLGAPCPILACACLNRLDHCLADCDAFPCDNFSNGPYPFSSGFLQMQRRRRQEMQASPSSPRETEIPAEHWQMLADKAAPDICAATGAALGPDGSFELAVLGSNVRVLPANRQIEIDRGSGWQAAPSLLGFVTLVYLSQAEPSPLHGRWVSEKDLACASFFRGVHELQLSPLSERFGADSAGFVEAAARLGGCTTTDPGDAAVRLWVFPLVPIKLIFWCGDDELEGVVTAMFDSSIEKRLPADAIWAMVRLVGERLVEEGR